jgi:tetratricopeptide (TPR) repeat protein
LWLNIIKWIKFSYQSNKEEKLKTKSIIIIVIIILTIFSACSVEKNTSTSRAYHNVTLKYNIFFNANEAYKRGINRIVSQNTDNYNEILPVFIDSKEEFAGSAGGEMDKAIQKSSKGIKIHSITKKPEMKNSGQMTKKDKEFFDQKEFNKWIDDCYLLMGKAYFIKRDYTQARHNFDYLVRLFPNLESRHYANLYLARTFAESGDYKSAKEMLDFIEAQKDLPKKLKGLYSVIYADFLLKQKLYEDAIPKLLIAIKNTKKKKDKLRYTYILAQLYEKTGNLSKASEMYEIVSKKNSSYEMEFNAKINMAKCFVDQGKSSKDIRKTLKKMLRDDKNIEYLDQIYFAIAEIDARANNINEAITNYKLSSSSSMGNDYQKAISCLKLGEIYFARNDYKNAQIYYDTCMAFLPATYENYQKVRTNSSYLNELVSFTSVVEFEDSVQKLAKLSDKERNKIIDEIIADLIEQERIQRELEQQENVNSMLFDQQRGNTRNNVNAPSGGKWYFYNPSQLSFGKNEFTKKWGSRKNEDNWRRKNKAIADFSSDDLSNNADSASGTSAPRLTNVKDRAYYLQDIPLTDSAMNASNERIAMSLFNIGRVYKERFSDYKRAIEAYEELNSRYPNNEYLLLSYYNLYLLNKLIGNDTETEKYKNLVISKFPQTNYAKLLQNPNYVQELDNKRRQDEQLYIETYDNYMKAKYEKVNSVAETFIVNNPDNDLIPNFDFLRVLCVGRTADLDVFKGELVGFMQKYAYHELAGAAENILQYFGTTDIQALIADLQSRPETAIENTIIGNDTLRIEVPSEAYIFDELAEHYYIIYVKSADVDIKRISFEIRNFNIFNFSMRTFNVINNPFDSNFELISVRSFKNQRQSVNYSKMIANSDDVFSKLKNTDYKVFVISSENFVKLQKNKNIAEYLKFYQEHY